MSNALFPKLIGETWPVVKRPVFSTIVQNTASGREVRVANWSAPRFEWEIPYSWLSQAQAQADFQTLFGFVCARYGSFDSFLFDDVTDNNVTGQIIGTGNGSTTSFQLVRTMGTSTVPVYDVNGIAASYPPGNAPPRHVYVNGSSVGGWTINSSGLLTFSAAPTGQITADFAFFWRVRFKEDQYDFSNFASQFWEAKKITLQQVRS